jgi:hypothetical protein
MQVIRNNSSNSRYSNYILNTGCMYGTVADSMDITGKEGKGNM